MTRTVLLIEDNEQNRYLTRYLLEARGYRVEMEADGRYGAQRAAELQPQIVLLDIQLPGMDGYAVARALRAVPTLASTPIIAVTSYAMTGDREKAFAAGCSGYIEKPIDPDRFVDEMERLAAAATERA